MSTEPVEQTEPAPTAPTESSPPAGRTKLTAERIVTSWHATDVALAPDGARVAWAASPYGHDGEHPESAVWVAAVGSASGAGAPRRWTRGGSETRPAWSPDGSRLAFLSDRAERGTAGVYVLDPAGGEAEPVAVRRRSVGAFAWSPDSSRLAFLAPDDPDPDDERRDRERDDADVAGERLARQRLFTVSSAGGVATPHTDTDAHLTALAWRPDGSAVAVLAQPTPELDSGLDTVLRCVVVSVSGRDGPDPGGAGPDPTPPPGASTTVCAVPWAEAVRWTADGSELVLLAPYERLPQSSTTVWRVRPQARSRPVVLGPTLDEECCAERITVPGPVAGTRLRAGVLVTVAAGLGTRLEERTPGAPPALLWSAPTELAGVDVVDTPAGPVLAVIASLQGGLPEVWAGPFGALQRLSDHHRPWYGVELGQPESFPCTAADGLALDAVLIRPVPPARVGAGGVGPGEGDERGGGGGGGGGDGAGLVTGPPSAGPWPTVVLPHGGPYGRYALGTSGHPLDWAQWLATAGYAVLLPDYRGGSGRGNAFATSVRGDLGGAEWRDVVAILDAAVERGIADPDRLGIAGWSQGGFLTAWGVTATDRFAAAVMGAGVSHWPAMALTGDVPVFEGALAGSLPWEEPAAGADPPEQRSPLTFARRITTPLLMVHGERDERVPVSQSVGLYRALRGGAVPVELVTYPREPHVLAERRHLEDVLTRVRDWFARHLPVHLHE